MLAWTLATALGLAALLEASALAFTVVKLLGGAYLIWIGLASLIASRRRARVDAAPVFERAPLATATAYRQGLLCNVANPVRLHRQEHRWDVCGGLKCHSRVTF
jgi:threonine/homoserine/homoserine lactone efflux protein